MTRLGPDPSEPLVLGPMLRYVDETSATIWVRTRDAVRVTVTRAGRRWSAPTFAFHGDHFALVVCDGLEPGSDDAYEVELDGERVWPRPGSPPSRIRTLDPGRLPRFAFGSCRTTATHDAAGNREHGVDPLRSFALALRDGGLEWPDLLLLLGDQVYADTTPHPVEGLGAGRGPRPSGRRHDVTAGAPRRATRFGERRADRLLSHSTPRGDPAREHHVTRADVAQLVERNLAKVEVAGSRPVIRSEGERRPHGGVAER